MCIKYTFVSLWANNRFCLGIFIPHMPPSPHAHRVDLPRRSPVLFLCMQLQSSRFHHKHDIVKCGYDHMIIIETERVVKNYFAVHVRDVGAGAGAWRHVDLRDVDHRSYTVIIMSQHSSSLQFKSCTMYMYIIM